MHIYIAEFVRTRIEELEEITRITDKELKMRRILIENNMVDPKKCSYGFPWKSDSICINFRMPEECVLTSDIDKITDKDNIETLVIG